MTTSCPEPPWDKRKLHAKLQVLPVFGLTKKTSRRLRLITNAMRIRTHGWLSTRRTTFLLPTRLITSGYTMLLKYADYAPTRSATLMRRVRGWHLSATRASRISLDSSPTRAPRKQSSARSCTTRRSTGPRSPPVSSPPPATFPAALLFAALATLLALVM